MTRNDTISTAVFMAASDRQLVHAAAWLLTAKPTLFLEAMAYAMEAEAQHARYAAGQPITIYSVVEARAL